ncbi:MAG TPA: hypothetical protein VG692_15705 [Gemmatimonadales bacterium]|nr:hypothetical protein [Gemmatimonadales bacterium]
MPRRALLPVFLLLGAAACGEQGTGPTLEGQWGGQVASLQLSSSGGSLQYQCGAGTINPGWILTNRGTFTATGEHFFGGGPLPPAGHGAHPARYAGHLTGARLVFTVTLTDLDQVLGPFEVVRGGPPVADMCL